MILPDRDCPLCKRLVEFRLAARSDGAPAANLFYRQPLEVGVCGHVYRTGRPWNVPDVPNEPTYHHPEGQPAIGSELVLPLIVDGDAGTLMPSGTDNNLFNVHAVDRDFAFAGGRNVILSWDGSNWSTITEDDAKATNNYTPVWAPPERDRLLVQNFQPGGFTLHTLCMTRLDHPEGDGALCRLFSSPFITFCGFSDDYKALQRNGTIQHFRDEFFGMEVFEPPEPMNVIAAYIPPGACVPGPFPPGEIFALGHTGTGTQFWYFDGGEWTSQGFAGPGQFLTGIDGAGSSLVLAVGGPGGPGIAWHFDGSEWNEETLPEETGGLADAVVTLNFSEAIFDDRFQSQGSNIAGRQSLSGSPSGCGQIYLPGYGWVPAGWSGELFAAGEKHEMEEIIKCHIGFPKHPPPAADVGVDLSLIKPVPPLSPGNPVRVGDVITYALAVTNHGESLVSRNGRSLQDAARRGQRLDDIHRRGGPPPRRVPGQVPGPPVVPGGGGDAEALAEPPDGHPGLETRYLELCERG